MMIICAACPARLEEERRKGGKEERRRRALSREMGGVEYCFCGDHPHPEEGRRKRKPNTHTRLGDIYIPAFSGETPFPSPPFPPRGQTNDRTTETNPTQH